ncbi:MAG: S8 family serine peptidase [Planctomycetes bacterium]|nr:S8 family serine peptidase [Planctomycetota bacterium]
MEEEVAALREHAGVAIAEPNGFYTTCFVPNDPLYLGSAVNRQRWIFNGRGSDRNLDAEAAWDITTGRPDVIIAVIDTGVDLDHPDLAPNIWHNDDEIAGNGIDDDGNGYVDDTVGWDFHDNDNDPDPGVGNGVDDNGNGLIDEILFHGTFVASCAAARGNDGIGIAGAAWNCRIMVLKVFGDEGGASFFDIMRAVDYAADNGASVINLSLGSAYPSQLLRLALTDSWNAGVVTAASAGNSNSALRQYPASFPNVISVGASEGPHFGFNDIDGRALFTQYGPAAVDVIAPGSQIYAASVANSQATSPGAPGYRFSQGTSFSSPFVAGLAALLFSAAKDSGVPLSNADVQRIIIETAVDLPDDPDDFPDAGADWDGHGRVSFRLALEALGGTPSIWVDFAHQGPENGSRSAPYDTLFEAITALVGPGTIHIRGGQTAETITLAKPMELRSDGGVVTIGTSNSN